MSSRRDDFPKSVKRNLRNRVNGHCSKPDCRKSTTGPKKNNDEVNCIGRAAHIHAAAEGGARYLKTMTREERRSFHNGIWLCADHASDIDSDEEAYPADLLRQWKKETEAWAHAELGEKPTSSQDISDTVAMALSGLAPKTPIANAISNVHHATKQSLEALDPRFEVTPEFTGGIERFILRAVDDVQGNIKIKKDSISEFSEKHRAFLEHGIDLAINAEAVQLEGSQLLEHILPPSAKGTFKLEHEKRPAIHKVWIVNPESKVIEAFDDFQGEVSAGSKSFQFQGDACNGLFKIQYQKAFRPKKQTLNLTLTLDYSAWEDIEVSRLPYFDKVYSLAQKIADGWQMHCSLEIDGMEILSSSGMDAREWATSPGILNFLSYAHRARIIAKHFNIALQFDPKESFTAEEHEAIADIADVLEGKRDLTGKEITSNPSCEFIHEEGDNAVEILEAMDRPGQARLELEPVTVRVFGEEVTTPPLQVTYGPVMPRILDEKDKINVGDSFRVEWIPADGFVMQMRYGESHSERGA